MSIVVQHRGDNGLVGVLELIAAQAQERRRREAEAQQAALQQQQADAQMQRYASSDQLARDQLAERKRQFDKSYALSFMQQGANSNYGRGGYGGGYAGRGSGAADIIGKVIDNQGAAQRAGIQGDYDLAQEQMRAQQEAQQNELKFGWDMKRDAMLQDAELRNQFAEDIHPDIQQRIDSRRWRYTPEQKTERASLLSSIAKARSDPSLTPDQRMTFEAKQYQAIRAIDNNPEPVPPDERPMTPQQEAGKLTWTEPDDLTGLDIEWQFDTRAGQQRKVPTATGQARIDAWKEREKVKAQQELELWKKQNTSPVDRYDAAVKSLMAKHAYDRNPYQPTAEDIEAEMALRQRFESAAGNAPPAGGPTSTVAPGQQTATQRPVWETLPDRDPGGIGPASRYYDAASGKVHEAFDDDGTARYTKAYVPVRSPEEMRQMNLPPNTPIILPDGRTGVSN